MVKEYIENEGGDWWKCLCGNEPDREGFYPCDEQGRIVEPTPEEWTTDWYVCGNCGRIIDMHTLEVVDRKEVDVNAK